MRSNRLSIEILKPVAEVFAFKINPENTPKWIGAITKEETNHWPPKIGTLYRNQDKSGQWSMYEVSNIVDNQVFELMTQDGKYHRRFTYNPLADYKCELEYFEWNDVDEITNPLEKDSLNKLKRLVEGV